MTLVPENTLTRAEIKDILATHLQDISPTDEIRYWTIEELAEEAQNPAQYQDKDEFLRAIAFHPKGGHVLVQLALASNEELPSDIAELFIQVSPYATVLETLIAIHRFDNDMVVRAREAIASIKTLSEHQANW